MVRTIMMIALLSCSWAFTCAHGLQMTTPADETANDLSLTPRLEVYKDDSGTETIESIQSKPFYPSKQPAPNFGFTRSAYWFKLSASNPTPVGFRIEWTEKG